MVFARREVWQEGKGKALIYEHKTTKIGPRNAELLQRKRTQSVSVIQCNNTQKDTLIVNLTQLSILTRGGWEQQDQLMSPKTARITSLKL